MQEMSTPVETEGRDAAGTAEDVLLYRVEYVAELLDISRSHVYALMSKGELPSVRIGRCRRIAKEDLQAWLRRQSHA